jgi:hypothetical protein
MQQDERGAEMTIAITGLWILRPEQTTDLPTLCDTNPRLWVDGLAWPNANPPLPFQHSLEECTDHILSASKIVATITLEVKTRVLPTNLCLYY